MILPAYHYAVVKPFFCHFFAFEEMMLYPQDHYAVIMLHSHYAIFMLCDHYAVVKP